MGYDSPDVLNRFILPYFTAFLLWVPLYSQAQSFELSDTEIYRQGKIGDRIEIPVEIRNLTNNDISIVIERAENNISNDQSSSICWGKECAEHTSLQKRIKSGTSANDVLVIFEAGLSEGYSNVKYSLFNINNPQDVIDLVIHYTINEPAISTTIYNSDRIQINEVYPNPVSDYLYINYSFKDDHSKAQIGIHNVLGGIINEYTLEPLEYKAKINTTELNPGVYFYSLSIDNETVLIKKFVVRK